MCRNKIAVSIRVITIIAFIASIIIGPLNVYADSVLQLPQPGTLVQLSPAFSPVVIKGLKINPTNPFQFDFIINQGQDPLSETQFREESLKLVKYFLASLTIPEDDLWVNLSPYEKNRIITPELGATGMGRDLLAQDYVLKQITSSLIYPEGETGKKFWAKVYAQAYKRFGTTNIPVNTFNKVWIVPQKAVVYENSTSQIAYVVESKLKVLLEEDYLALQKHTGLSNVPVSPTDPNNVNTLGSQIVREIVIPELDREVNEGKNFASLRQATNSLILAAWFKRTLKASILGRLYVDQKKIAGVDLQDKTITERIFEQYLRAYKKGVYNYIKEEEDPLTHEVIPRKYFSGGVVEKFVLGKNLVIMNSVGTAQLDGDGNRDVTVELDKAMISGTKNETDWDSKRIQKEENATKVRGVFQPLFNLIREHLEKYGPVDTPEKQQEFGDFYLEEVQHWLTNNRRAIENVLSLIPEPKLFERYKRNLILHLDIPGLGLISLFVHKANTETGTGPHFHGIAEEKEVGEMAFVAALDGGLVETRFQNVNHRPGETNVWLVNPTATVLAPYKAGVLVDATYGAHRIEYLPTKVLGPGSLNKKSAAFLEIYIYPEALPGFDSLFKLGPANDGLHLIIRSGRPEWIKDRNSIRKVARVEGWQPVSNRTAAVDEILASLSDRSLRPFTVFNYTEGRQNSAYAILPNESEIKEAFNDIKSADVLLRDPNHLYYLIVKRGLVGDRAMTTAPAIQPVTFRIATQEELKDPSRSYLTADGITRDGSFSFEQDDLPSQPVDVVFIGAGPAGLAGGIQAVDSHLTTVILESGYVAQSFSDAFMNFWRMRTPAFRFSLVQKGFNSLKLQELNLINPNVLAKFRALALKAAGQVNEVLGKNFSIAQPVGFNDLTNATVPVARAEAFQHLITIANAIVKRGGLIRENDPVVHVQKREDGLFEVTTRQGIRVLARNVVYATGFGNEKFADILSGLSRNNPRNYILVLNPQQIPNEFDPAKLPILNSGVLNDPRIAKYIRSLPEGTSIGVVGGGQSAGNSAIFIQSIRPDIVVHIFTRNKLKVHGSQMPGGFRKAHLMWEYVNDDDLRRESWSQGGPEVFDTPITPPIFNYINHAVEQGKIKVHVLGKYFDGDNYQIQTTGTTARIIDRAKAQEIAIINGGFISAIGYSLNSPERNALYADAKNSGLIQINGNGLISVSRTNGLTSALNEHVYIAGVQLLGEGAVTDGSTHGTVVRARAIVENIKYGSTSRLSQEERLIEATNDYQTFLDFVGEIPDKEIVTAFLTLAHAQAGETVESIKSKYLTARENNEPLEAARYISEVAGQTGRVVIAGERINLPSLEREEIIKRIFATDMPGYLEQQDGRQKISALFDRILPLTGNDSLAVEQLLYPATEYGVGETKTLAIYNTLKGSYNTQTAAVLVRAALSYLPLHENDRAQIGVGPSRHDKAFNPGGIDLNTANLDLQIKRDGKGFPLPVTFQNLENIHINGLVPVIINIAPISNLQTFLGVNK